MNRIALHHSVTLPLPPVELVELARRVGCDSVGLRVASAAEAGPWWQRGIGSPMLGQMIDALLESRVTVLDVGRVELGPELHVVDYAHPYLRALELGSRLGAQFVTARAGAHPALREHFAALADLAHRYGLRPLLHAVPGSAVRTLDQAVEVLGATGGGVVLDVAPARTPETDAAALEQTVVELGARLGYVRVLASDLERNALPDGLLATLPPQIPVAISTDEPGYLNTQRVERLTAMLVAVDRLLRHPRAAQRHST